MKKHRQLRQLTENAVSSNDSTDVELDNSYSFINLELEVDDIEHYCSDHLYNVENIEDSYLTDSSVYNRSPD